MWNGLYRCPDFKHIASVQQFIKGSQTKRVDKNEKIKMWYILYLTIYYRLAFLLLLLPTPRYKRDGWTIIRPKSYAHAAVTTSVSVSRFRPHSACCSYFQKPSIVMFPSIYRCVFFLSIFFPTLNNRISDILWGGKLIFFFSLPLCSFSFFTAPIVHHFSKHDENACLYYLL